MHNTITVNCTNKHDGLLHFNMLIASFFSSVLWYLCPYNYVRLLYELNGLHTYLLTWENNGVFYK